MKIWLRLAGLAAFAALLSACTGFPVSTDYDSDWHFKNPSTFAWLQAPQKATSDPLIDNDLVARRVHRAVSEQLEAKGVHEATTAPPDLLVTYHVGEEDKLDISSFRTNFGYYPCWHCFGGGFDSDVWATQYTQGKLVVDLIDAGTKQLVWRGVAERRLPVFNSPADRDSYIRETVAAIFKRFPPDGT